MSLNFSSLLADRNIRAFLHVIREGETSQEDDAYRTIVGGGRFDSFAQHPNVKVWISTLGLHSTAAGAYQFLARTWQGLVDEYRFPDFRPYTQDCGAVALIYRRDALYDVLAGNLNEAIRKCNKEWASLPGSPYGHGGISIERCRAVWERYGGNIPSRVPQPAAPIEDRDIDGDGQPGLVARPEDTARLNASEGEQVAPFLAVALPALMQALPELLTLFGKKPEPEKLASATKVADIVMKATGAVNIQDAVDRVTTDPVAKAAASAALQEEWYTLLTETGSGGIAAARASNLEFANNPRWWAGLLNPVMIVTVLTLPLVYIIVLELVKFTDKVSSDVISQTIGMVIGAVLGGVMGFWMGQTFQQRTPKP